MALFGARFAAKALDRYLDYSVMTSAFGGFLKMGCSFPLLGLVNMPVFQLGSEMGPVPLN